MASRDSVVVSRTRIAALVPTHNRWGEASSCLRSLLEGQLVPEIVLVDDGSTDGTSEACGREFPAVRILRGDGQLWWSGAINLGLDEARRRGTNAVLWLNDDNRVEPDTLSLMARALRELGDDAVVCATVRSTGDEPAWVGQPPVWHPDFRTWLPPRELPELFPLDHPPGGRGVLFPKRCFEEVGGIDQRAFPHYWADHDFHYRAMKAGFRYYLVRDAVVWTRPNEERRGTAERFTLRWAAWFLFERTSPMNLPTLPAAPPVPPARGVPADVPPLRVAGAGVGRPRLGGTPSAPASGPAAAQDDGASGRSLGAAMDAPGNEIILL